MHANELFLSPNREWVEKARAERLLGEFEATKSGRFYEDLAQHPIRQPLMTKYGMEVFKKIPSQGMTVDELLAEARDEAEKHDMEMALNLLEARGFIEILPDGNIVETEAGELMDKAMSGVPAGFGAPINPVMYRVSRLPACRQKCSTGPMWPRATPGTWAKTRSTKPASTYCRPWPP